MVAKLFIERPEGGLRALLVFSSSVESKLATLEELEELVLSAGLDTVATIINPRKTPHPKSLVGSGKLQEICLEALQSDAGIIVFSEDLSPSQEKNIEQAVGRRVMGRTGLILEIFAQRARTHEGKLQVELAQLQHAASRLVRGWTHLDRQRGGSGKGQGASAGLSGDGETQLEADQRQLRARTKKVNQRLVKVQRQRGQNRKARQRSQTPSVALAGYTNSGKSTLFNALSNEQVHAADQLFATLDPTLRQIPLPVTGKMILSDTVGFIRALPHTLIEAFKATLEEVTHAALILHVVDAAAPEKQERIDAVNNVLSEIGAQQIPQLLVLNKSDLVATDRPVICRDSSGSPVSVRVSALRGEGLDAMLNCIDELLGSELVEATISLKPEQGMIRARCFNIGCVIREVTHDNGVTDLYMRIEKHNLEKLNSALMQSYTMHNHEINGKIDNR